MIKLTKIAANPESLAPQSSTIEEYRTDQERGTCGQFHEGKSPPIEYEMVGRLFNEIKIGVPIGLERFWRSDLSGNLIRIDGVSWTSPVQTIFSKDGKVTHVETANSIYLIEDFEE